MEIVRVPYDHPDAVALMARVQQIYVERYGGPDASPMDPAEFTPPAGEFFLGRLDGQPVATGAWRHVGLERLGSTATAEVKRMYVVEQVQRRGLARLMLAHLERSAAAAGHDVVVLNTGPLQPEAIALYESAGYQPVPGWGVYACHPEAVFLAKRVAA
ncbi:GNAT family N-acetyltransferase [Nocardioides jiangxiensis]|uniref:GNAT family N-acetyltransferase n=1 Tax=Nocardioides jiangxiensis TaxID=3064524 RepID=A0ABT9AZ52_9ACTN|nr:GNAT family N-acetyltransferase [Nocardioides sp. WY-20]MDO7867712.1 GNAT family N-acetyltransferase [Nocardioides sp. WY-20]